MQISRAIFTLDDLSKVDGELVLREKDSPSQFHHLARVLRVKENSKVELLDESSPKTISTTVKSCSSGEILLTIAAESNREINFPVTLILGLPEFNVLENVIEKITEIQLNCIKIFIPDNTQHKNALKRLEAKLFRLEKIRNSARIQSGSGPLKIEIFNNLEAVLTNLKQEGRTSKLKLIASLQPNSCNLQEFLHKNQPLELSDKNTDISLVVGPEGDLSFEEYKMCSAAGFSPISLGNSVLRVETAAIGLSFSVFNYFNR
jgi:16S rRNA (uracil1498-N3)-methyltransferase